MSQPDNNPYVGPRSFSRNEAHLFFGREREARELLAMVISERVVLFHAQSGAGKSSLLNTRLIPALEDDRGFQVLLGRVGGDAPPEIKVNNIFVYNLLLSLNRKDDKAQPLNDPNLTLKDFLRAYGRSKKEDKSTSIDEAATIQPRILIIDQFEEILTTHLSAWAKRKDFFKQLSEALDEDEGLWVVLTMREEYVAALAPDLPWLEGKMRARFYMERLAYKSALEAVKEPAQLRGHPFAANVAERLVYNLRRHQTDQNSLTPANLNAPPDYQYVEPLHLQLVCRRLWANLPAERGDILMEDVTDYGNVDEALVDFYRETLQKVVAQTHLTERRLRKWIDTYLITPARTRALVYRETHQTQGLPNEAIDLLVQTRLIRAEQRGPSTGYELTHDRLVGPLQKDNAHWFEDNLSALQRQAEVWETQKRSDGFLLQNHALKEAEQWAAAHRDELTETEQEFLTACRVAQVEAERERRRTRLIRGLGIGAMILGLVALGAFVLALSARNTAVKAQKNAEFESKRAKDQEQNAKTEWARAEIEKQNALANQLAAQTLNRLDDVDQALLLSLEANNLITSTAQSKGSLGAALEHSPHLSRFLHGHKKTVNSVAFSPNGQLMASSSWDETIIFWNVNTGEPIGPPLTTHADNVLSLAFSPNGQLLASGSCNDIILWDVPALLETEAAGNKVVKQRLVGHSDCVDSLAFSPDGALLVSGARDKTIRRWSMKNYQPVAPPLTGHTDDVRSLTFNENGSILASGSEDKTMILWRNITANQPVSQTFTADNWVVSVAFSPVQANLLAIGVEDDVILWDTTKNEEVTTLSGHEADIFSLAFSADGQTLASGSEDRTIRLWDVATGRLKDRPLTGHHSWVRTVAFSREGVLASGSDDDVIILWDVTTNQRLGQILAEHPAAVRSLAISPDGQTWVSGSSNGQITFWDADTRQPLGPPLEEHSKWVNTLSFNADGTVLASGSDDGTLVLWNVAKMQPLYHLSGEGESIISAAFNPQDKAVLASGDTSNKVILWNFAGAQPISTTLKGGHTDWVRSVAFSPDGRILASASDDQTVILWDMATEKPIHRLSGHKDWVMTVTFSPDGETLVSAGKDKTIILWNVNTGGIIHRLTDHENSVMSVAFNQKGDTLASGSWDKTVRLWDVAEGKQIGLLKGHTLAVENVFFNPRSPQTLISSSLDGTIRRWDTQTQKPLDEQPLSGPATEINSVAFSPDGKTLASGSGEDGAIFLWDATSGVRKGSMIDTSNRVTSLVFYSDQNLISGSRNGSLLVWEVEKTEKMTDPLKRHTDWINSVAVNDLLPDSAMVASASDDNTILLWNFPGGEIKPLEPFTLTRHTDWVLSVAFSPDKKILASGSRDRTIILWDVETKQPMGEPLEGHDFAVNTLAFSPDSKTLASGGDDDTIILWSVETHRPIAQPLTGHIGSVYSIAFNAEGDVLASGSEDGTIILWDVGTGQAIGEPLTGHTGLVKSIAFSPDGLKLASGGTDGKTILWNTDNTSWQTQACAIANRNFTWMEWEQYFRDDLNYRKTCPALPAHPSVLEAAQHFAQDAAGITEKRDKDKALVLFNRWLELNPALKFDPAAEVERWARIGEAERAYREGLEFFDQEKYDQAVERFTHCIELDSKNYKYYYERGWAYKRQENYTQAIADFNQAVQLKSDYDTAYDGRGKTYLDLEDYEAAIRDLTKAIELDPDYAGSYESRGDAYAKSGNYKQSIADYTKAIELNPENTAYYYNSICWFGSLLDHAAEVLDGCDQAVELASDDGQIRDSRGVARALTGDYDGAIEDFEFFLESGVREELQAERKKWIAELKADRNPFNKKVLADLLND